ncbi:MAG: bifunctional anthranilate synthase component I family protein/class IV aminotransferase [Candidatus Hydrogenedentes bacterium]|nr:bifunctional anthranilate synthase component I family protein/class IV aminotransferase [Candidatus Hydrogenedentota bacterium]
MLRRVEQLTTAGAWALGFVSYEAAPAFEPKMETHTPQNLPLAAFYVFPASSTASRPFHWKDGPGTNRAAILTSPSLSPPASDRDDGNAPRMAAMIDEETYRRAVDQIRERIAAGETYQVNFTFPLAGATSGSAAAWFEVLCTRQGPGEYYYLDFGRFQIACVSPELFFSLEDCHIEMRPMKGTRPRGRWLEEDLARAEDLRRSEKDQAENVMVVDMIRNDLGRIAEKGSVAVTRLFEVERYETVWQMTSTVCAHTHAGLPEIFGALFPSASVTGAPKIETMKVIRELEQQPRGVYCGAVGWWGPGRRGRFSVAIRTATIDAERGSVRYPVGSGITWGSSAADEYEECLQKAALLSTERPQFQLLETLLFEDGHYFLLDLHLERLRQSAHFFDFHCDVAAVRRALDREAEHFGQAPMRVRLLLDRDGGVQVHPLPLDGAARAPLRVALAKKPVDSQDIFLFHKTTHRKVYEARRQDCLEADDVILWNERGEVTESTIANVVIEDADGLWTPPRACGLLAGTFREHLLQQGIVHERKIAPEELGRCKVYLVNSVRKWMPVTCIITEEVAAHEEAL